MKKTIGSLLPVYTKNKLLDIDFTVLGAIGFTPEQIFNSRSLSIFLLSLLLEVLPEFYFILHHIDDVQSVFMCLHEFLSLLVYVVKVFIFYANRHKIISLIYDLKEEWRSCKLLKRIWLVLHNRKSSDSLCRFQSTLEPSWKPAGAPNLQNNSQLLRLRIQLRFHLLHHADRDLFLVLRQRWGLGMASPGSSLVSDLFTSKIQFSRLLYSSVTVSSSPIIRLCTSHSSSSPFRTCFW